MRSNRLRRCDVLRPASHYDDGERDNVFDLVGEEREEPPPRNRKLPAMALTLLVMLLFAGGLWFAYTQGKRDAAGPSSGSVPLIRADDRPTKVKPDQPGGMPIPDQNVTLYRDRPGNAGVERLLPPPEQPLPRPAPPPTRAPAPAPPVAAPLPSPAETMPSIPLAPAAAPPGAGEIEDSGPKPSIAPNPIAPPKVATAVPAGPGASGKVEVRLGSLRSPEAAKVEWTRLKRENADLLGNLRANAVSVDLGEKGTYYRIVAGPFADSAAAERLCAEMKRRNHGCILAR